MTRVWCDGGVSGRGELSKSMSMSKADTQSVRRREGEQLVRGDLDDADLSTCQSVCRSASERGVEQDEA